MKLSPERLMAAPELAALAVLDTALHVAIFALAAAWPELHGGDLIHDQTRAALDVIEHARALSIALRRYRRTLALADRRELDLPF
jgi:hypothetical protein